MGLAKAQAIEAQVKAYGGAEYRVIQEITDKLADAVKNATVDIVPKTVVQMGSGENGSNGSATVMDTLLRFITLDKLGVSLQHMNDPSAVTSEEEPLVKSEPVEENIV